MYATTLELETNQWVLAITIVPFLINMILFLQWKYRSTSNAFSRIGPQTITPAGAVYWYFVPVAWFWKPYEAMLNLKNAYHAEGKYRGVRHLRRQVSGACPDNVGCGKLHPVQPPYVRG